MTILVLKAILAVICAFLAWRWMQGLSAGSARFGQERLGVVASRSTDPVGYWLIMCVNAGAIAFFVWLIVR
jgi:hypothetical protein